MARRKTPPDHETITRGTGNVFADLGYADADERQIKLRLAYAINSVIARKRLTQASTAAKLGVNQPKISALANYKLDGFSVERLMTFLTALDRDIDRNQEEVSLPRRRQGSRRGGVLNFHYRRTRQRTCSRLR